MTKATAFLSLISILAVSAGAAAADAAPPMKWATVQTEGAPAPRHEAGFVEHKGKLYLLGGRRINPVNIFDPASKRWTQASPPPIEIHHFQAVSYGEAIWVIGAMTGGFPDETPVERVLAYYPEADRWEWKHEIPAERRRGGAGLSEYKGTLYLSCGIVRGHRGGFVPWFDAYDPETGEWTELPDAPRPRDHFQSAIVDDSLYAAGGRTTSFDTQKTFELVIPEVDRYDFDSGSWSTLPANLPTPRAGNTTFAHARQVIVVGGESASQVTAHSEVEAYHVDQESWRALPQLQRGRHGTGVGIVDGVAYTASGSGNRGGEPELDDIEAIACPHLEWKSEASTD